MDSYTCGLTKILSRESPVTALTRVTWIGPSQVVRLCLGSMYIDVSFPRPFSAPYLDIQVHRHSNCTGLRSLYYSARVSIDRVAVTESKA